LFVVEQGKTLTKAGCRSLGRRVIRGLHHDPQQGLGPRRAHPEPAAPAKLEKTKKKEEKIKNE
jgi:hypothetical protein